MKRQEYQLKELEGIMRKVFSEGGTFPFYPRGTSMLPTIRPEKDQVVLAGIEKPLKKYDAVLYKRKNGAYVLHRIVRIDGDCYTMRGDNQVVNEPGIEAEQIIGIVKAVVRDGKASEAEGWRERARVRRVIALYPVKKVYRKARGLAGKVYRKLFR